MDALRHGVSPVWNPYNPLVVESSMKRPSLHQTTILESLGREDCHPSLRQTTIPESLGRENRVEDSTQGNIHSSRRGRDIMGGAIVSPRHRDRAMHACTLGASCFDVICLATKEYHVGIDGIATLTEADIQDCGYGQVKATAEDAVVCYNDIILAHCRVCELWFNGYAHTSGPQVDKILQKSLSVFPHLESTRADDVVAFYDCLQEVSLRYIIAIMPFEAIVLAHRFKGLCPPGLGLVKYAAMCKALMELLLWLIPGSISPQPWRRSIMS